MAIFDDDALGFTSVPPSGAVDYLRNLTPTTRDLFDGLLAPQKQQAFTIAGISDVRIISEIQTALVAVIATGGTEADFKRAVNALTSQAGIAYLAQIQIDYVFRGAFAEAYSAGRLLQLTDPDVVDALPYWQLFTAGDGLVRPSHQALDLFVARFDDPVWKVIFPPIGFGCRCTVVALDAEDASGILGPYLDVPGLQRIPARAQEVLTFRLLWRTAT